MHIQRHGAPKKEPKPPPPPPDLERTCRRLSIRPEGLTCRRAVAEHRLPHNCYEGSALVLEGGQS